MSEKFRGFSKPSYTQVPDEFFDELAPSLTESELRVLAYIIRRTFGFKKQADAISLTQLTSGIPGFDKGTGMHRSSVMRGCKGLIDKGIITVIKVQSDNGEYETNVYALRFADEVGAQSAHPRRGKRDEVGAQSAIQQTDQQTDSNMKILNPLVPSYDELMERKQRWLKGKR